MSDPNRNCPDTLTLRIFAEGELASELGKELEVAEHVAACEACRLLVEQARREEAVLREQLRLPAGFSLDGFSLEDLHAETLRALDKSQRPTSSRRTRAPEGLRQGSRGVRAAPRRGSLLWLALSLVLLGAAGVAVHLAFRHGPAAEPDETAPPREPAPGQGSGAADPGPVARVTPTLPDSPTLPDEPGDVKPDPVTDPKADPRPDATDPKADPGPRHDPEAPPSPVTPKPDAPPAEREERPLAVVRSGKLSVAGKALAVGELLPEGETVETASSVTELESADAARLLLASGTKLSVSKGDGGKPVFFVASGKLLASTSGTRPYAITSADARATPQGTSFLVVVEPGKTRVSTLEGRVRVDIERAPPDGQALDVRAGFEVELSKGKHTDAPHPFVAARAVAWLPETARPKAGAAPRIVRAFGFEDAEGFNQGVIVAGGAHGSRHALKGETTDEGSVVALTDERAALDVDGELWVQVNVKVSKAATVVVELGAAKRHGPRPGDREQWPYELRTKLEAGRWTTITAPVKDFVAAFGLPAGPGPGPGGPGPGGRHWGGGPRPQNGAPNAAHKMGRFAVRALNKGEAVELLVDDVRFYRYDE